ncbi:MAG: phosphodiesterase [Alphaproteobacteria bacterium]|jgi:3',5'-cyclic AMP phosphodiesterase CpdA|nr:phosphodiesterase [Alphaproteobacteria bacterium]HJP20425.1 phosphodiesterase [Alphaproteobacteria bacterium]
MIIAQISDLHISGPEGRPDLDYATADHLARCVVHLNALDPRPDLVMASGDLVDQGSAEEYRRLAAILKDLELPWRLLPGNHDQPELLRQTFADHDYLPAEGPFLHYVIEDGPLRILALDTHMPGQVGGGLCDERLDWLAARLEEGAERPTLIFMHHPPFESGIELMDRNGYLTDRAKLGAIIAVYPNIVRIACGHLHRPVTMGWQGTVVTVAPGAAHQLGLDLRPDGDVTVVLEPPACQLHVWKPDIGLITHTSYVGQFDSFATSLKERTAAKERAKAE